MNVVPTHNLKNLDRTSFIINLSIQGTPGTHFVAIVKDGDTLHYLDPIGWPPFQVHVYKLINTFECNTVLYNKTQIQAANAETCALYCAYFVLLFEVNYDNAGTTIPFQTHLRFNNFIALYNVKQLIRKITNK